jgi:hypothetical protein
VEIWLSNSILLFLNTSKEFVVTMLNPIDVLPLNSLEMLSCLKVLNLQLLTALDAQKAAQFYMITASLMLIGSNLIFLSRMPKTSSLARPMLSLIVLMISNI